MYPAPRASRAATGRIASTEFQGRTQNVSALAFCLGLILTLATGVFYLAGILRDYYRTEWAISLCHQAPGLCANPLPLACATGAAFVAYFFLEVSFRDRRDNAKASGRSPSNARGKKKDLGRCSLHHRKEYKTLRDIAFC
jgi:hypothetical protein